MQDGWDDESYAPVQDISEELDKQLAFFVIVVSVAFLIGVFFLV